MTTVLEAVVTGLSGWPVPAAVGSAHADHSIARLQRVPVGVSPVEFWDKIVDTRGSAGRARPLRGLAMACERRCASRRLRWDVEGDHDLTAEGRRHLAERCHRRGVVARFQTGDGGFRCPDSSGECLLRESVLNADLDDLPGDLLVRLQARQLGPVFGALPGPTPAGLSGGTADGVGRCHATRLADLLTSLNTLRERRDRRP
jgi:hypothetical protein